MAAPMAAAAARAALCAAGAAAAGPLRLPAARLPGSRWSGSSSALGGILSVPRRWNGSSSALGEIPSVQKRWSGSSSALGGIPSVQKRWSGSSSALGGILSVQKRWSGSSSALGGILSVQKRWNGSSSALGRILSVHKRWNGSSSALGGIPGVHKRWNGSSSALGGIPSVHKRWSGSSSALDGIPSVPRRWNGSSSAPGGILSVHKRWNGSSSALGSLLGIPAEAPPAAPGQHPPPVATDRGEQKRLLENRPDQPQNPRVLRVAIIGAPNAGKSTLSNQLLGRKVFPVSKKVHTTRCKAQGVITHQDTQLIILDTPGLTNPLKAKRHNLDEAMLTDPWDSMKHADLVLVLVDVSDHWTRNSLSKEVLKCLSQFPHIPSVLVLNKVDILKKKFLLLEIATDLTEGIVNGKKLEVKTTLKADSRSSAKPLLRTTRASAPEGKVPGSPFGQEKNQAQEGSGLDRSSDVGGAGTGEAPGPKHHEPEDLKDVKGWPHFQEIFMLAALRGEEVDTLKRYLLMQAKPGPWEFHSDVLTNQSPQEVCDNIIREKVLEYLPLEVPYGVTQVTEVWEEGECGELVIMQSLLVPRESHKRMLIGRGGKVISRIAREAGQDLMNTFLCDVHLKLKVEVKS